MYIYTKLSKSNHNALIFNLLFKTKLPEAQNEEVYLGCLTPVYPDVYVSYEHEHVSGSYRFTHKSHKDI